MNKLIAVVFGLLLVCVLASVASADYSLTGSYEFRGKYNMGKDPATWQVYGEKLEIKVKVSNDFGPASADLTWKLGSTFNPDTNLYKWLPAPESANLTFEISDGLSFGAAYRKYKIDTDERKFKILSKGDEVILLVNKLTKKGEDWTLGTDTVVTSNVDFKTGSVSAYVKVDKPFEFAVTGTYNLDPVTLKGWVGCDADQDIRFLAKAVYPVMDKVTATGEYLYDFTGDSTIGLRVDYKPSFSTYGKVFYNINTNEISYKVWGEFPVVKNVVLYGWYTVDADNVGGFYTVGAKYVLGGPNAIIVEFPEKDNTVYVKLAVSL
ncbi:MAG: hypothetical protein ACM3ZC_05035 [Bacteroidota bacterium]